jgi:nitrogen-specific signal transduction histidine kinase/CheY-like chemotaxis protein
VYIALLCATERFAPTTTLTTLVTGQKNIVIVDSDAEAAAGVKSLLLAGGCEMVHRIAHLRDLKQTLEAQGSEFALVTLEPSQVGEQLHAVRELQRHMNVAVAFVVDDRACVELVKLGGVQPSGYVMKPVEARELWVVIDAVSRMRKIEVRLHRLESRLREVQRLESIGVVAGWIAHDFNNLITGIYGAVAIAQKELGDSSPARQRLAHIERAASRAAELCQRLVVSPGNGGSIKAPLNLNEVSEEAAKLVQEGLAPTIVLQTGYAADVPPVFGVEAQLRQAVINLLTNSVEAMTNGSGMIRLVSYVRRLDEKALSKLTVPGEAAPGEFVVLEIADTGCGMEKAAVERMFDPLYSTKGSSRGLGLAAVARIVRKHRGAIEVDTSPGHGACMRLFFPAYQKSAQGLPLPDRTTAVGTAVEKGPVESGRTVLVVDDDDAVRALARWVIEKSGFPVVTARDGDEAVRLFVAEPNKFFLLLLDLTMPRMGGLEAMRKMREVKPHQKVIIATGHGESLLSEDLKGHDVDFLQKPFTPDRLRLVLQRYATGTSSNCSSTN